MTRFAHIAAATLAAAFAVPTQAETIDLNVNNDTLRAEFQDRFSVARYDLGLLSSDYRDIDLIQPHLGILVTGDAGARDANVTAGVGARLALFDTDGADGGALGLGGTVEARLPAFNRIGVVAYLYWAPGAAAFGDLEEHLEYHLALDYEVLQQASVYVGYRQIRVEIDDGPELTAEKGFNFGLRLHF